MLSLQSTMNQIAHCQIFLQTTTVMDKVTLSQAYISDGRLAGNYQENGVLRPVSID